LLDILQKVQNSFRDIQAGNIFCSSPVNTGRQLELDVAKALAVLFMIAAHVLGDLSEQNVIDSFGGSIVDFFGGIPAAPVFMFALGFGIIYSRNAIPEFLLKRGIRIFLLGYLLNLLRGGLPLLAEYAITGNETILSEAVNESLYIDILQFAGLAFLFFAFAKRLNLGVRGVMACGLFFSVLNIFVVNIKFNNSFLNEVASFFWGAKGISYFPFLTWIFYPIAGYVFGYYLVRCIKKDKLYFLAFIIILPLFITLLIIQVFGHYSMFGQDDYYHHTLFHNCTYLIFILLWISALYYVIPSIPKSIIGSFKRWSKNITAIYFIQWCIIGWLAFLFGYNSQNGLYSIILFVLIVVFSDGLSFIYKRNHRS
jgi:uncharacterized membrane protein